MAKAPNISKTQISETPQMSFPDPKSVARGLQSAQTSGAVPSNSRGALQHGTSPPRHAEDPSTEMLPPEWLKLFRTHRLHLPGAERQNYDLIAEMPLRPHSGDPTFQDWRCWRKMGTHNMQHWPHHIPTIFATMAKCMI